MFEYMFAFLFGLVAGTFTGLIPGVHINLISTLIISYSIYLTNFFSPLGLGVFIMTMSVTHTFLDSIPSIFLGAPDSDMALGVLPGHRFLLKGHGFGAVHLTVIGSFSGLIISIILFPLLVKVIGFIYPIIKNLIAYFLIAVVIFMIFREKNKLIAIYLFIFSGLLGLIVLNFPNLDNPLFPLLSGLFGVSGLIISLNDDVKIPTQQFKKLKIRKKNFIKSISSSVFVGSLTSMLPGLGPAQGAVIGQQLTGNIGGKGFLVLLGGLNTVNMVLSLVTFYVLDKARNGSVIALSELINIDINSLMIILFFILLSGITNFFWAQKLTKVFAKLVQKIDYFTLSMGIISLIILMSFLLSGWIGLLILITATLTGLIAPLTSVSRSHAMGCLMIPVISYFIF